MNEIHQRRLYVKLSLAIQKGNIEQVRQLIADGVDVNTVNNNGYTPLSSAIMYFHINIVRVLIEAGADVNIANEQLFSAVKKRDTKRVSKLIAVGVNVNIADENGCTPLNLAARLGHTKMVETLINEGAGVNIADKNGYTPLHWTILQRHIESTREVIETLINEGADVNMEDQNGSTPLNLAVGVDDISAAELIVNHIVKLEAAGLYVSEKNLQRKNEFIQTQNNQDSYSQHLRNCEEEVEKIEKESQELNSFLKESDIDKLISMWKGNAGIRGQIKDQDNLKKQYPEYAHILINKADKAKKEIFLRNNKQLIDSLSTHYRCDFQTMTFASIKNFFDVHEDDLKEERIGRRNNTLTYFVDWNVEETCAPKLESQAFAVTIKNKGVNSNFNHPNAKQHQAVVQARS